MLDVPFGKQTDMMDREIGETLGGFVEFDNSNPLGWEEFMRIKVMLDLGKPLHRELKMRVSGYTTKWMDIKYERLPNFCYYCGRLGQVDRDISIQGSSDYNVTEIIYQSDPWLCASPRRRCKTTAHNYEKEKVWLRNPGHDKQG